MIVSINTIYAFENGATVGEILSTYLGVTKHEVTNSLCTNSKYVFDELAHSTKLTASRVLEVLRDNLDTTVELSINKQISIVERNRNFICTCTSFNLDSLRFALNWTSYHNI